MIGKWKMRRIRHLEILWLDEGWGGAFSAMSSDGDGVDGWDGVFVE